MKVRRSIQDPYAAAPGKQPDTQNETSVPIALTRGRKHRRPARGPKPPALADSATEIIREISGVNDADDPTNAGRYQALIDSVRNWHRIGFVIQGSAIDGDTAHDPGHYLEVLSQLDVPEITPWPTTSARSDNYSGSQFSVKSP